MRRLPLLAALGVLRGPGRTGPLRDLLNGLAGDGQGADGNPWRNSMIASGAFTLPDGASAERDVAYGDNPAQLMDVYRPKPAQGAPLIFMVHGGGWSRGDKGLLRSVKNKVVHWVAKGYVLVSVNYRVIPEAEPIEQAADVGKALAYVQAQAQGWGADPAKVVLMGHSAGAHLVSLISADPTIATRQGARPWLGTVAIDGAAFDLVEVMSGRHFGLFDRAFGNNPESWREASPLHRLKGKLEAPLLAVCSTRRNDSCAQARSFAIKAESMGGRVSILPVDLSHGDSNDLLGAPGEYTADVEAFIRSLGLP